MLLRTDQQAGSRLPCAITGLRLTTPTGRLGTADPRLFGQEWQHCRRQLATSEVVRARYGACLGQPVFGKGPGDAGGTTVGAAVLRQSGRPGSRASLFGTWLASPLFARRDGVHSDVTARLWDPSRVGVRVSHSSGLLSSISGRLSRFACGERAVGGWSGHDLCGRIRRRFLTGTGAYGSRSRLLPRLRPWRREQPLYFLGDKCPPLRVGCMQKLETC